MDRPRPETALKFGELLWGMPESTDYGTARAMAAGGVRGAAEENTFSEIPKKQ